MEEKIIQQGAEAIIIQQNEKIIKHRTKKSYRIEALDEKIRKSRTRTESKLLEKASVLIPVPRIIKTDEKTKEIIMDFINGKKLSECLDDFSLEKQKKICEIVGKNISKIHNKDIIHGDLTTSNMILVEKNTDDEKEKIYFIDFGLGFISKKIEDKAVDIHLFRQALEAKHFKNWNSLFNSFIEGYKKTENSEAKKILERFKAVEKRGRYKN